MPSYTRTHDHLSDLFVACSKEGTPPPFLEPATLDDMRAVLEGVVQRLTRGDLPAGIAEEVTRFREIVINYFAEKGITCTVYPAREIEAGVTYEVRVKTELGSITFELHEELWSFTATSGACSVLRKHATSKAIIRRVS